MRIQILILLLVLLYYFLLQGYPNKIIAKNKLANFSCLLLTLYSGLRHVVVGSDTFGYYGSFMSSAGNTWTEVLSGFLVSAEELRDPLYPVIEKVFSTLIPSWQLYLIALAIFFYFAVNRLWKRYICSSEGILLATMLMLSLFSIITLSGIRQQITIAISMFLIPYIEDKRWKIVVPIVLVSSFIHVSLLLYLAFIPLQSIRHANYKSLIGVSILLIPVVTLFARNIVVLLAGTLQNDYYMTYALSESSAKPYLYITLCSIISLFLFFNYSKLNSAPRFFVSALILMTITVPLIIQDGSLIRISQYFTIYMMLSLPYVLDRMRSRSIIYIAMMFLLTIYIIKNSGLYYFFWQRVFDVDFMSFGLIS